MDFFPGFFPGFFGTMAHLKIYRLQEPVLDWMPEFWDLVLTLPVPPACKTLALRCLVGSWNLEVSIGDRFLKSVRAGFLKPRILKNHEVSLMMRLILLLWMLVFRHFHVFRLEDPPPSLANFQGNSNQPFKSTP